MSSAAEPATLSETIPVFPLAGVLLLPGSRLPLHIFEPRYRAMLRDALADDATIGMIQPRRKEEAKPDDKPELYETGCLGRITAHRETEDGRWFITLTGLCRFRVVSELPLHEDGYRRVQADYAPFLDDLDGPQEGAIDRTRLLMALRGYLAAQSLNIDWSAVETLADAELVSALAVIIPFAPSEKQALLEAPNLTERARVLVALLEMALLGLANTPAPESRH